MEPIDLDRILDIAAGVAVVTTLWATGIGLGISVRMSEIVHALARQRLVARVVALDLVLVPLAMWACVQLLVPDDGLATGLLLVAFAAAGPLGIKLVQVAGGDAALAVGLVVVLELANLLAIPLWSSLLGVASTADVGIDIIRTPTLLVLAPLAGGLLIARWIGVLGRRRLARAAAVTGNVGLVIVVAIVTLRNVGAIGPSTAGAVLAAVIVIVRALVASWLAGGPDRSRRTSASLVTGVRANAAALAVATTSLAHIPHVAFGAVIARLVSVLVPTVVAGTLAAVHGRHDDRDRGDLEPNPSGRLTTSG